MAEFFETHEWSAPLPDWHDYPETDYDPDGDDPECQKVIVEGKRSAKARNASDILKRQGK